MVLQSLEGLPAFIAYFCLTMVAVIVFLLIYTRITPYSEFDLIRKNIVGASIALGLSLLGFALPLASAVAHTADLLDCAIWAVIALIVQLIAFYAARIPVPRKPLYSREGANIELVSNGRALDKDDGPYGAEGYVRQAIATLPQFDGNYTVLGSWFAAGAACGLSVREGESAITKNTSRYLPHGIIG